MTDAEMSTKEEFHLENPLINEVGNLWDGDIQLNLNKSQYNKSELQRTVKELRSKLKRVKKDNERILKDQKELNTILLSNIRNDKKEKNNGSKHIMPKNAPYKCNGRKLEFSNLKP